MKHLTKWSQAGPYGLLGMESFVCPISYRQDSSLHDLWVPKGRTVANKGTSIHKSAFSSVQSCPTLCNPMDCSTPGFPAHPQLLELSQTNVQQVSDTIQLSHSLPSPSPAFNLSQHQSFPMSQFCASGHQSIGASSSASVFSMNIQDWFPLGLTGLISLQSKGYSRVFSNTTV